MIVATEEIQFLILTSHSIEVLHRIISPSFWIHNKACWNSEVPYGRNLGSIEFTQSTFGNVKQIFAAYQICELWCTYIYIYILTLYSVGVINWGFSLCLILFVVLSKVQCILLHSEFGIIVLCAFQILVKSPHKGCLHILVHTCSWSSVNYRDSKSLCSETGKDKASISSIIFFPMTMPWLIMG